MIRSSDLPVLLAFSLLIVPGSVRAAETPAAKLPTAQELLAAIDKNLVFETRTTRIKMVVEGSRRTRTFEMITYARGKDDAAVEYLAPAREKGTKMLKIGGDLWLYLPAVDRVQKISGHMLRQGMMGSDMSYEDMMASQELADMYAAKVTGDGEADGRPCWKLELIAKDKSISYPKRVTWVDKETYIPIKQEMYALSGMLVKTWSMSDVKEFEGGRKFPTRMVIKDQLKKSSVTRIEFEDIGFGVELEREVFSRRWLERR